MWFDMYTYFQDTNFELFQVCLRLKSLFFYCYKNYWNVIGKLGKSFNYILFFLFLPILA